MRLDKKLYHIENVWWFFSQGTIRVHQQIIRNHSRSQRLTIIILFDDDDDMIRLVVQNYERDYAYYSHDVQHENTT